MAEYQAPLLIIGAGISGLTLAQACRKQSIPYRLFERDGSPLHRSAGWGLTLNFALPHFRSLVPEDILRRLPETYVNRDAVEAGEKGTFTFFDLSTGEAKWKVPATERIRVSRDRLRALMLTGLDIEWNKTLVFVQENESGATAVFNDGSTATGAILVGCDGSNSLVRRRCRPLDHRTSQLPVRFIGAAVHYSRAQIAAMEKLDPFFLQGSDPRTDVYLWFSFLNTPGDTKVGESDTSREGHDGRDDYYCQIMTSWPYRAGFLGSTAPTEMPDTREEQLKLMKSFAKNWAEPCRSIVSDIPSDAAVMPIHLADYIPRRTTHHGSRVVLLGDAAHAMVMYRGEAANHAIVDVDMLLKQLQPLLQEDGEISDEVLRLATKRYETEMIERTEIAVLASRQACLDAHDWSRLDENSPLVKRRLIRADPDYVER